MGFKVLLGLSAAVLSSALIVGVTTRAIPKVVKAAKSVENLTPKKVYDTAAFGNTLTEKYKQRNRNGRDTKRKKKHDKK